MMEVDMSYEQVHKESLLKQYTEVKKDKPKAKPKAKAPTPKPEPKMK